MANFNRAARGRIPGRVPGRGGIPPTRGRGLHVPPRGGRGGAFPSRGRGGPPQIRGRGRLPPRGGTGGPPPPPPPTGGPQSTAGRGAPAQAPPGGGPAPPPAPGGGAPFLDPALLARPVLRACNTTDLNGRPLLVIFKFRGHTDPTTGRPFADILGAEGSASRNWHVEAIRQWATAWNNDERSTQTWLPSATNPRAHPVSTVIVVAPFHRGNRPNEPDHITLAPAAEHFWNLDAVFGPTSKRPNAPPYDPSVHWSGVVGLVHIYCTDPPAPNGARTYTGYWMHAHPEPDPLSSTFHQICHRDAIKLGMDYYTGGLPSADRYNARTRAAKVKTGGTGAATAYKKNTLGRLDAAFPKLGAPAPVAPDPADRNDPASWAAVEDFECHEAVQFVAGGAPQWLVSQIVGCVVAAEGLPGSPKGLHYQVWTGWPPDEAWYPAENFKNCPVKLDEWHSANTNGPRRPGLLRFWLRCYAQGIPPASYANDNEEGTE